jgi:hypothetical protein
MHREAGLIQIQGEEGPSVQGQFSCICIWSLSNVSEAESQKIHVVQQKGGCHVT